MPRFPLALADLDAVLAPLAHARSLPAAAYWDEAVFAFDQAEIFDRAWRCVGRDEDIGHPGAWLLAPLTEEGILVIRGADLVVRAFYNVCRHRAATLVDGASGRVPHIVCPYHGWTYELSGALRTAPDTHSRFDCKAHGLRPARVDAWQGFLFVSLDPEAEDLAQALAGAPPWLARADLARLRRGRRVEYEVRANWKLCAENFQESHHFPRIHPELEHLTHCEDAESVIRGQRWLGGVMELVPHAETVSKSGKLQGRPFVVPPRDRRRVCDAMLFPGMLTSLQPDYLLTYCFYPRAADRTLVVAETYFHPAALAKGFDGSDVYDFWDTVNREDRAICERQQRGMGSRGYTPGVYAMVEDGVHAFDGIVAGRYRSALSGAT